MLEKFSILRFLYNSLFYGKYFHSFQYFYGH